MIHRQIKFCALFLLYVSIAHIEAQTLEVRGIRDSVGFCWDAVQMLRLTDYLASVETLPPSDKPIIAAVSPHDDYLYAGRVYYPLFHSLRTREAVIFGVTHGTVRKEIGDPKGVLILESFDAWTGPAGPIPVSPLRDFIRKRLDTSMFVVNDKAHRLEHSIEALLPFLQHFNPSISITPIMVTAMPFGRMDTLAGALSEIIAEYMRERSLVPGTDLVFLASSDANHYGRDFNNAPYGEAAEAHANATREDKRIADECLTGGLDVGKIGILTKELEKPLWCGKFSIPFGLLAAFRTIQRLNGGKLTGRVLRYSDTYTEGVLPLKDTGMGTTAPSSLKHWVGFLSAVYNEQ
jgi:MEMO1 family protein